MFCLVDRWPSAGFRLDRGLMSGKLVENRAPGIDCDCSTKHDEKAKKTGEIIFSVTQNLTCELPQFLRDFGDYACKLKNYIILSQFVILLNVL